MELQNFNFNTHQVRIEIDEHGNPWFCAKDVCDILEHTNARMAISDLVDQEDVTTTYTPTTGGKQKMNFVNESGLYALIFGSRKEEAKPFKKWVTNEVLPNIRKNGFYSMGTPKIPYREKLDMELMVLETTCKILKASETSKLRMISSLKKDYDLPSSFLPSYSDENNNNAVFCLTCLLKQFNIDISAREANKRLLEAGIIEQKERDSSKGKTKKFWSIVNLRFGKNEISPKNLRETQPLYYEQEFMSLSNILLN
jgi:prophage antirepressor-like protein